MILLDRHSNFDEVTVQINAYIESKHWADLTLEEMELIQERSKKVQYKRNFNKYFSCVINPLYNGIENKGQFKFSNPDNMLTCRNMVQDLMNYYYGKGFTREDIAKLATEMNAHKKH